MNTSAYSILETGFNRFCSFYVSPPDKFSHFFLGERFSIIRGGGGKMYTNDASAQTTYMATLVPRYLR